MKSREIRCSKCGKTIGQSPTTIVEDIRRGGGAMVGGDSLDMPMYKCTICPSCGSAFCLTRQSPSSDPCPKCLKDTLRPGFADLVIQYYKGADDSVVADVEARVDWSEVRTFKGHTGMVRAVSLSSDGKRAISGSEDKTLILWDVENGKPIRTFNGHTDSIYAVNLSSDGKRAVSGSLDRALILWDVKSGKVLRRLYAEGTITSISQLRDKVVFGDVAGRVKFLQIIG